MAGLPRHAHTGSWNTPALTPTVMTQWETHPSLRVQFLPSHLGINVVILHLDTILAPEVLTIYTMPPIQGTLLSRLATPTTESVQ